MCKQCEREENRYIEEDIDGSIYINIFYEPSRFFALKKIIDQARDEIDWVITYFRGKKEDDEDWMRETSIYCCPWCGRELD